jgi:hypothetical protein
MTEGKPPDDAQSEIQKKHMTYSKGAEENESGNATLPPAAPAPMPAPLPEELKQNSTWLK